MADVRRAGYQGPEHSSADVTFYSLGAESGFERPRGRFADLPEGKLELLGRGARGGDELTGLPTLISVDTQKAVAGGAGTFQIGVKAPRSYNFGKWIADDDWVDIVMSKHDRKFHVMRGLVDTVRRDQSVSSGATTQTWVINGRDFQRVWEDTVMFFNRFAAENVVGGATMEMFLSQEQPGAGLDLVNGLVRNRAYTPEIGSLPVVLIAMLTGFLRKFEAFGRATWQLPFTMPITLPTEALGGDTFIDNITYQIRDFTGEPRRAAYKPMFHHYNGMTEANIWSIVEEWSDPQFCEVFTELLVQKSPVDFLFPDPGEETGVDLRNSKMAVIIRDRPFPTKEAPFGAYNKSAWFDLPLFELNRQEVVGDDIGRGGRERRNVFMFQPIITQETSGFSVQLAQPLWDTASVRRHGVRKMEVESKYISFGTEKEDVLSLTASQRLRIRDWFMLNHLYYNGSISLPNGRPDIKVGTRVRIRGELGPADQETYYVETVGHSWRLQPGVRTTLGVTRGWHGDDPSYLSALTDAEKLFKIGLPATPSLAAGLDLLGTDLDKRFIA